MHARIKAEKSGELARNSAKQAPQRDCHRFRSRSQALLAGLRAKNKVLAEIKVLQAELQNATQQLAAGESSQVPR